MVDDKEEEEDGDSCTMMSQHIFLCDKEYIIKCRKENHEVSLNSNSLSKKKKNPTSCMYYQHLSFQSEVRYNSTNLLLCLFFVFLISNIFLRLIMV